MRQPDWNTESQILPGTQYIPALESLADWWTGGALASADILQYAKLTDVNRILTPMVIRLDLNPAELAVIGCCVSAIGLLNAASDDADDYLTQALNNVAAMGNSGMAPLMMKIQAGIKASNDHHGH